MESSLYSLSNEFHQLDLDYEEILSLVEPLVTEDRRTRLKTTVQKRTATITPVLENLYDKGNISAVLRSADAFGFYNINVINQEDAKFKAANRVSQGVDKWLNVKNFKSTSDCIKELKDNRIKIYCTHLEASVPIEEIDFVSEPCAVVLGNEKDGVSPEFVEAAEACFVIPMQGFAQSFNISVAGALSFYHIFKQLQDSEKSISLDEKEQKTLYLDYLLKTIGGPEKLKMLLKHGGHSI